MTRIALLPGDGIGPEVTKSAESVLRALVPSATFDVGLIGYGAWKATGQSLPEETVRLVDEADATLLGAVTTPTGVPDYRSPILQLRQRFELFANVRPARSAPHESSRPGIDLVVVRENTEGLYCGVERRSEDGRTAVTERVITHDGSERVLRFAFDLARRRRRKHVTVVHKANVLRETCGLFLEVAREVAAAFPDVESEEMLVDTCAMRLIRSPEDFSVLCTTNLFGDILSDEAAELVGGLGLARSSNLGRDTAVFEPVHGSAPDIAGTGKANPLAALGAAAELLEHLDLPGEATQLNAAIRSTLEAGRTTPDMGGGLSTAEVTDHVVHLAATRAAIDP